MRAPLLLELSGVVGRRVRANYARPPPLSPAPPSGFAAAARMRHWLAALAFRRASTEQLHAARMCADLCANVLGAHQPPLPSASTSPPQPAPAVLELGCGAGHALSQLLRLLGPAACPRLVGVDESLLALDLARRALRTAAAESGAPAPSVRLFQCGAQNLLPINTASCRIVMHANCWFAWPRTVLLSACSETYRVLECGGRLVSAADYQLARRFAAEFGAPDLLDLLAALEGAGFSRIEHRRAACPATGRRVHLVTAEAGGG